MILLPCSAILLIYGVTELFKQGLPQGKISLELGRLIQVKNLLQDLDDMIQAGILPRPERWEAVRDLPAPWSPHLSESLLELRASGGAILPTLRRMRGLALAHEKSLIEARAKSAQSWAQALICLALVPIFSALLYRFLPGVELARFEWMGITTLSLLFGLAAAFWIVRMSESARWGGLPEEEREWILPVLCFGERILALIQAGNSSDQAWTRSLQVLPVALQAEWKGTIFEPGPPVNASPTTLAQALRSVGSQLKRSIHASLIEGRPCFERIELVMQGFQQEMRAHQERELQLLATRAMKPLFICVAPAIFILLIAGLFFSFTSVDFL